MHISVIIPAYNAAAYLPQTLTALRDATFQEYECIVVDDHSDDATAEVAHAYGARVVHNDGARGPGAARNLGARAATGDLLLFLDADCAPHANTLQLVFDAFAARPEIAAVFGSYDDDPAVPSLVSAWKNLMHHYVHHHGNPDAQTFWTGCGAVRAEVFREAGDFLPTTLHCVEDIEYGHRLRDKSFPIWLRPDIQVKHLKRWTLPGLIRTDVLVRGIPWTVMMLRRGKPDNTLNLTWKHKVSAVLACTALPLLLLLAWSFSSGRPGVAVAAAGTLLVAIGLIVFLNLGFYGFLARKRGLLFAVASLPLHLLYYHYSVGSFVAGVLLFYLRYSGEVPSAQAGTYPVDSLKG